MTRLEGLVQNLRQKREAFSLAAKVVKDAQGLLRQAEDRLETARRNQDDAYNALHHFLESSEPLR